MNLKLGRAEFKRSSYSSRMSLQMARAAVGQERSMHRKGGRSRLSSTGRRTLIRSGPKWKRVEPPPMGMLLDVAALEVMIGKAASFFASSVALGFETGAHFDM